MNGVVYWITGLSGAGKTTVGNTLYEKLRAGKPNVVILDGDTLRKVINEDIGYTREDREKGAYRNAKICEMLSRQGIDVICCTISMFDCIREWNRKYIPNYVEIFLDVTIEVLEKRDQKGLYSGLKSGEIKDVVGVDLELELPKSPDLIVTNHGEFSPEEIVMLILDKRGHNE